MNALAMCRWLELVHGEMLGVPMHASCTLASEVSELEESNELNYYPNCLSLLNRAIGKCIMKVWYPRHYELVMTFYGIRHHVGHLLLPRCWDCLPQLGS